MTTPIDKFQTLLRRLFQFDCADLDFGVYRIMNYKRGVIEKFITQDLPRAVADELDRGALADQSQAARELKQVAQQIKETLGKDALDADGNLTEPYRGTPLGTKYQGLKSKAAGLPVRGTQTGGRGREALQIGIFNHLYAFFSRYYQDGDFISKRRYSKRQKYAIPYNGEEVYLYWANNDQYYVKTAEYFHDYTFTSRGVTVHFKLQAADVEQNNVKGDKRFFLPRAKEIAWDEKANQVVIPFEYRPLTEQEEIAYGKRNQQDAIITKALEEIPNQLGKNVNALRALAAERRETDKGKSVSYLEHHLRQYTRRNTSDFFIHKDLKGFLSRELDFYQKNEVLNLDEMETAGEGRAEGWFQITRAIKAVGGRIIEFLDQIERFQKMLWEKRKFITETQYCITIGNIDESFYPDVAACEPQWAEWKELKFAGNAAVPAAMTNAAGNAAVPAAMTNDEPNLFSSISPASEEITESLNKGWYSRGYLPHLDAEKTIQFISFRLHDSVPTHIIEQWKNELRWTEETTPDSKEAARLRKKTEEYEDSGKGTCYLHDKRIAALVQEALKHFDGVRYRLIAWCVMPNHVHILVETKRGYPLSDIVHGWKSFTAHKANNLLGRSGKFWMTDYFDRFIRDEKHFAAVVEYICQNPVQAGLVDMPEEWPWSGKAVPGNAAVPAAMTGNAAVPAAMENGSGRDARDPRINFLKTHPTLVLDTKHFDADFVDNLLASMDNLDGRTDSLLIHSENFQALNLLLEKYRQRVQCVHIDPPYNTQTSGFLYKNDYLHSSWLAMMENRIVAAVSLLHTESSFLCHIDENEYERLHLLFERLGIPNAGTVVWDKRNPMTAGRGVATQHEYVIWRSATDKAINLRSTNIQMMLSKAKELIRSRGGVTEKGKKEFAEWVRKHPALSGGEKAYCYLDDEGRIYQSVSLRAPEPRTDPKFFQPLIHPVTGKPCAVPPNGFSRTPETLQSMIERGEIIFGADETTQPRQKYFLSRNTRRQISSVIQDAKRGKTDLDALGLENFPYCHSVSFYMELLGAATSKLHDIILDHFAGSGTTGHAVINLNREDGGSRKFILVEMGGHFDAVLLPRIKKITFTPEWKDGKPKRMATQEEAERSPRIVKYVRLESYEDALNNIEFEDASGQQALKFEDYLLKYMLKWETRASETLLNVEKLARPFSYKLHIHADGQTHEKVADIPETFNYLLGLHVQTRRVYYDDGRGADAGNAPVLGNAGVPAAMENGSGRDARDPGRRYLVYRGRIDHRQITVIWRETEGWQKADLERDKKFVAAQKLTEGADEVFVNGDSFIPNARALEPVFKARMFASVEV